MIAIKVILIDDDSGERFDDCLDHFVDYWPAKIEADRLQEIYPKAQISLAKFSDDLNDCPFCEEELHFEKTRGGLIQPAIDWGFKP